MERVTCIGQGQKLLNNFNFQLFGGEIMGLVPLDSYGLDEFIDCVANNRQLLYGRVYIREKLVNTYAVHPRMKNNVYSILKDENLIQGLLAADNVFLIREGYKGFFINDSIIQKQLKRLFQEVGMDINTKKKVKELTTFEKYIIEIVKAAVGKADVVILRDIGSSLHPEVGDEETAFTDGLTGLGMVLLNEIGGSMGPIYGTIFMEMADAAGDAEDITLELFGTMLSAGLEGLYGIVDARPGDKTLVDTLSPCVECIKNAAADKKDYAAALDEMKECAEEGKESTKDMVAMYGRASRLGERSKGVLDAGATSCCIILKAMAEGMKKVLE